VQLLFRIAVRIAPCIVSWRLHQKSQDAMAIVRQQSAELGNEVARLQVGLH
jgi:hypothetical protein